MMLAKQDAAEVMGKRGNFPRENRKIWIQPGVVRRSETFDLDAVVFLSTFSAWFLNKTVV